MKARDFLLLALSLLLFACHALDQESHAPHYRIPAGTSIDLHQDLIVPPDQAGVYIQGTSIGNRHRYDATCRLEIRTVNSTPRTVRADRFTVERVSREREIFSSRVSSLHYARFEFDGSHLLRFTTYLYLRSAQQPDVFRLTCRHLQNSDQMPRHLTVDEIRTTLKPVMTLHINSNIPRAIQPSHDPIETVTPHLYQVLAPPPSIHGA